MAKPKQQPKQQEKKEALPPIEGLAVGRTVHFHEENGGQIEPRAALIAYVLDPAKGRCNLLVADANGNPRAVHDKEYRAQPEANCWGWPPKV